MKTLADPSAVAPARTHHTPCLTLMRGAYPNLTEAERRVADYVLASPDKVLLSSISEVAREGGVGASTLTRLAVKLGYLGYPEMRTALAVELLNRDNAGLQPLDENDDAAQVTEKVLRLGIQNLHDTIGLLDPNAVERAAKAIVQARRLHLYAVGPTTAAMVHLAQERLLRAGVGGSMFINSFQLATASELLGPGDTAIGFSHTGEGKETVVALRAARMLGATTICLTNVPHSSITQVAEIPLLTAGWDTPRDEFPAASMVAMTAAIDILYARALLLKHRSLAKAPGPDPDQAGSLDNH